MFFYTVLGILTFVGLHPTSGQVPYTIEETPYYYYEDNTTDLFPTADHRVVVNWNSNHTQDGQLIQNITKAPVPNTPTPASVVEVLMETTSPGITGPLDMVTSSQPYTSTAPNNNVTSGFNLTTSLDTLDTGEVDTPSPFTSQPSATLTSTDTHISSETWSTEPVGNTSTPSGGSTTTEVTSSAVLLTGSATPTTQGTRYNVPLNTSSSSVTRAPFTTLQVPYTKTSLPSKPERPHRMPFWLYLLICCALMVVAGTIVLCSLFLFSFCRRPCSCCAGCIHSGYFAPKCTRHTGDQQAATWV